MSYLALNPSTINDNDEIIGNYTNSNMNNLGNKRQLRNSNNKTIKKRYNQNVQNMLQTINNSNANTNSSSNINDNTDNADVNSNAYFEGMENENNEPADFNPPNYAELTKTPNVTKNNSNGYPVNVTKESFKGLTYSTISNDNNANNDIGTNDEYVKPFINYNSRQNEDDSMIKKNKDTMLEKLNYMIMLLEEQQNERTDHIMEELILYFFLGIFMIFMVDSFVRSGKYVR